MISVTGLDHRFNSMNFYFSLTNREKIGCMKLESLPYKETNQTVAKIYAINDALLHSKTVVVLGETHNIVRKFINDVSYRYDNMEINEIKNSILYWRKPKFKTCNKTNITFDHGWGRIIGLRNSNTAGRGYTINTLMLLDCEIPEQLYPILSSQYSKVILVK